MVGSFRTFLNRVVKMPNDSPVMSATCGPTMSKRKKIS